MLNRYRSSMANQPTPPRRARKIKERAAGLGKMLASVRYLFRAKDTERGAALEAYQVAHARVQASSVAMWFPNGHPTKAGR